MALFLGLQALNAQNFESGLATDGQVLTADGVGGAAFEAVPSLFIGDVSDDGDAPTQASIEAAFVALHNRPSVHGDFATCIDLSGELGQALLGRIDQGGTLYWTALIGSWINI